MLKKELLDFVEKVKHKAIKSVNEKFSKEIEAKKKEMMVKYEGRIDLLQDIFNRFSSNLSILMADMKEDKEVSFSGSYDIRSSLEGLSKIKSNLAYNCDFKGEVEKIRNARDKEINEVKSNYYKVYTVCKSMSSAKKIAEYLKELGFDISSLEKDEITSLVAEIDKSKLFVCGENK